MFQRIILECLVRSFASGAIPMHLLAIRLDSVCGMDSFVFLDRGQKKGEGHSCQQEKRDGTSDAILEIHGSITALEIAVVGGDRKRGSTSCLLVKDNCDYLFGRQGSVGRGRRRAPKIGRISRRQRGAFRKDGRIFVENLVV